MRSIFVICAAFLVSLPAPADAPPGADKPPVAVVDLQRVIFESPAAKGTLDDLNKYVKEKQAEIDKLRAERDKVFAELREKGAKLKDEERAALEKKADEIDAAAAKILRAGQLHINRTRTRAESQLRREAERLVRAHAKEHGFAAVVDISNDAAQLFFPDANLEPVDITDAIAKKLEAFKIRPPEVFQPDPKDKDPNPLVVLHTSMGDIVLELDREKAPLTVGNFLKYVDDKHFDGTIFHRVIDEFMIQGGGFTPRLIEKETRDPIPNESKNGLKNLRGTIAMARTDDPDSATAQFYINVVDNDKLNYRDDDKPGYCVFGKVVKGMDVVDKIKAVKTGERKGMADVPLEPVLIKSVERVKKP